MSINLLSISFQSQLIFIFRQHAYLIQVDFIILFDSENSQKETKCKLDSWCDDIDQLLL